MYSLSVSLQNFQICFQTIWIPTALISSFTPSPTPHLHSLHFHLKQYRFYAQWFSPRLNPQEMLDKIFVKCVNKIVYFISLMKKPRLVSLSNENRNWGAGKLCMYELRRLLGTLLVQEEEQIIGNLGTGTFKILSSAYHIFVVKRIYRCIYLLKV